MITEVETMDISEVITGQPINWYPMSELAWWISVYMLRI